MSLRAFPLSTSPKTVATDLRQHCGRFESGLDRTHGRGRLTSAALPQLSSSWLYHNGTRGGEIVLGPF